jgi:hypothetical protein
MPENQFSQIVEYLANAVKNSQDKRLCGCYAEYLVAFELSNYATKEELGYKIKVLRKRFCPDLEFYDVNKHIKSLIEVKSSHINHKGFGCSASFGNGKSIEQGKFNCCVFVVFEKLEPIEYLVFTLEELKEVIKSKCGAFPNNPYLLSRCKDLQEYEREFLPNERLDIEINLHQNPDEFRNRWDKIVPSN